MFLFFNNFIEVYKNNIHILVLTIIFLIIIILGICFYNKFRGFMGEFWLKKELYKLPKKEYLILNDVMIKSNNKTYQIDHIVISKYGIFVIEMKNYYGRIYGNTYKKYWYQYVYNKKRSFYNPIYQNYGHVKALEDNLKLKEDIFIPIICFSNQAKINVTSKNIIINLDYINDVIKSYKKVILNDNINIIRDKIISINIKDKKIRKMHVKNIKKI